MHPYSLLGFQRYQFGLRNLNMMESNNFFFYIY